MYFLFIIGFEIFNIQLSDFWRYLALPGVTWPYLALSGLTWPYLALPGVTLRYLSLPGVTWHYLALPGDIWRYLCFHHSSYRCPKLQSFIVVIQTFAINFKSLASLKSQIKVICFHKPNFRCGAKLTICHLFFYLFNMMISLYSTKC
jgi:hypothetical protein